MGNIHGVGRARNKNEISLEMTAPRPLSRFEQLAQMERGEFFVSQFSVLLSPRDLAHLSSTCRTFRDLRNCCKLRAQEQYLKAVDCYVSYFDSLKISSPGWKQSMMDKICLWKWEDPLIRWQFFEFFYRLSNDNFKKIQMRGMPPLCEEYFKSRFIVSLKFEEAFRAAAPWCHSREILIPKVLSQTQIGKIAQELIENGLIEEAVVVCCEGVYYCTYGTFSSSWKSLEKLVIDLAKTQYFTCENLLRIVSKIETFLYPNSRSFLMCKALFSYTESETFCETTARQIAFKIPHAGHRKAACVQIFKRVSEQGDFNLALLKTYSVCLSVPATQCDHPEREYEYCFFCECNPTGLGLQRRSLRSE